MNFDKACDVILMTSIWYRSGCFIEQVFYNIPGDSSKKLSRRNSAQVIQLNVHILQLINV